MKLAISNGPARAAAIAAIVAQVFMELALDAPAVHSGAWVSALLGGLMAVPWLLSIECLRRQGEVGKLARLPLRLALLSALIPDIGRVLLSVFESARYLTLDQGDSPGLLLAACLAMFWCLRKGGDAVGYGAMGWLRLLPPLLLVIFLLQLGRYRPEWLRPALGLGWREIFHGGGRTTGRIMLASGILLVAEEDGDGAADTASPLRALVVGTGVAAALILLRLMMTPTMLRGHETWLKRLDSLLVNGRAPLYLQMPMIVAWFAGLMHLLACEGFAAAALLQRLIPRLGGGACAAWVVLASAALARLADLGGAGFEIFAEWSAIALLICAAFALIFSRGKEGDAPCAD